MLKLPSDKWITKWTINETIQFKPHANGGNGKFQLHNGSRKLWKLDKSNSQKIESQKCFSRLVFSSANATVFSSENLSKMLEIMRGKSSKFALAFKFLENLLERKMETLVFLETCARLLLLLMWVTTTTMMDVEWRSNEAWTFCFCSTLKFSFNSPFNAPISFGTAMKRLELAVNGIILINCLLCKLHEVCGFRVDISVVWAVTDGFNFRQLKYHEQQQPKNVHKQVLHDLFVFGFLSKLLSCKLCQSNKCSSYTIRIFRSHIIFIFLFHSSVVIGTACKFQEVISVVQSGQFEELNYDNFWSKSIQTRECAISQMCNSYFFIIIWFLSIALPASENSSTQHLWVPLKLHNLAVQRPTWEWSNKKQWKKRMKQSTGRFQIL